MTFLFVTWSGGGNIHPLVALATRLVARGHDVRVLASPILRERFTVVGASFEDLAGEDLRQVADDVAAAVSRGRPDALVVDYMQPSALCAGEASGVPVVAYVHTLYQRVAIGEWTPMAMSGDVDDVNSLRHDLGLPPVASLPALFDRCARVLVMTTAELDRPHDPVAANVRHVGPLLEDAGADAGWEPPGTPLVHASMGTVAPDETTLPVVQRVMDAMADRPVHVFATFAGKADKLWESATEPDLSSLRVPPNATVSGYVRHAAVLPHTAVLVTHAGLGSVGAALTFGVPMVCLPLLYDQPANAAHVAAIGAGINLDPDSGTAAIRSAIAEVLGEPRYRDAAARVASSLRADGSGERAVTELEALVT